MRHDAHTIDDGQLFTPEIKADIKSTQRYMLDMLVMLAAPTVVCLSYYGLRALYMILTSVAVCVLSEYFGGKLLRNFPTPRDLSAAVTGICLALCLPAGAPYWFVALGASFAILAAKLPFGNARSALFSPTAAGLCFLAVCFPNILFTYPAVPAPGEAVSVFGSSTFSAGVSMASMLSDSTSMGSSASNYITALLGNIAGPMGAVCILALCGALLYQAIRRFKSFEVTASFLLTAALFAFCFPRILTGRGQSVFMELSSGMLLFAAVFLLPSETHLPRRFYGRLLYGCIAGLFTMLLRRFGAFEESVIFILLLMNVFAPVFNRLPLAKFERIRLQKARMARRAAEEKEAHEQWFKAQETEISSPAAAEADAEAETENTVVPATIEAQILQEDNAEAAVLTEEQAAEILPAEEADEAEPLSPVQVEDASARTNPAEQNNTPAQPEAKRTEKEGGAERD